MLTASLPMYNIPEIRRASSSLWRGIAMYLRQEGVEDVPDDLLHDIRLKELLSDGNLLFSQCCGYDVVHSYSKTLNPFAVPVFDVAECAGCDYSSLIVVAEDSPYDDVLDMRGKTAVANGPESHSGMNSLRHLVAPKNINGSFFCGVIYSGAHVDSMKLLREKKADVAAIDCVTYKLLETYQPGATDGTKVLGRTFHAPAPPYVTHVNRGTDTAERLRTAVFRAFEDPDFAPERNALLLKGIGEADSCIYEKISDYEVYAAKLGYPELR